VRLIDRLIAGEHHAWNCTTWEEVAKRYGVTDRSLRAVRKILRDTGREVGLYRDGDKNIASPIYSGGTVGTAVGEMGGTFGPEGYTSSTQRTPNRWPSVEAFDAQPEPRVEVVEETLTRVDEHRLRKRVRDLESENRKLVEQLSDGGEYHEVISEVLARQHEQRTTIAPREYTSGLREGTPLVLASDWHVEEEVLPEQVAGRNRYNLEIASQRMQRFFESVRWAIGHQREAFQIRDMICWWGGDFITNFLHGDNVETNLLHPTEAILFAQDAIIAGIDYWLQDGEIERFVFPCNDGNHGRTTKDLRAGTRTKNSLEVFLYAQLANHYKNEPRVRFILPTSAFTFLDDVYGKTIRFTHGDTFNYGGGIGGIMVPMLRAIAGWESAKRADLTCMGNWHQRICLPTTMVNGSLIGYSSYAMKIGCRFEPPVQSMRMLDARRWCSTDVPLWVSDRADDDETWRAA
jgi:hypothetical protein